MRHALSRRGQWPEYLNIQGCRITTESGVPVSTSDRSAQGSIYLLPANGNLITLPTGVKNSWVTIPFDQQPLGLTVTSGKNYDVIAYLLGNSGFGIDLMPAWTDDTNRATAVETFNGFMVNAVAFTGVLTGKQIPIRRGLVVGTIRASASNQTEDSVTNRLVYNPFNQVLRSMLVADFTSHTFTTLQEWRNGTQLRLNFVLGTAQTIQQSLRVRASSPADDRTYASLDGSTGDLNQLIGIVTSLYGRTTQHIVGIGFHYVTVQEQSESGTGTHDFGDNKVMLLN